MTKNTIIIGDSYSTFENYVPDGNAVYYLENGRIETDITNVHQTWWYQVVEEANLNLILNDSWSGSTIGYTGYNNIDCSQSSSFIYRFNKLVEEGFFINHKVDTVFIFGGTNDSCSNAPLGSAKWENWEKNDLYSVLPAIYYFFSIVRNALPQADIYCLINTEMKMEIAEGMEDACKMYDISPIKFDYIDKKSGHPTIKGMQDIKIKVLKVLE